MRKNRGSSTSDTSNYRVGLRFLDRLVVELLIEYFHFTQVVSDAVRIQSERNNRLQTSFHILLTHTHTRARSPCETPGQLHSFFLLLDFLRPPRRYSERPLYFTSELFLPRTVIAARRRSGTLSKVYQWLDPRCRHKMTPKHFLQQQNSFGLKMISIALASKYWQNSS